MASCPDRRSCSRHPTAASVRFSAGQVGTDSVASFHGGDRFWCGYCGRLAHQLTGPTRHTRGPSAGRHDQFASLRKRMDLEREIAAAALETKVVSAGV